MAQESNRREFTRISVHMEAEVTSNETSTVTGNVRNVSMNGLFLECQAAVSIGTPCLVIVRLGDGRETLRIQLGGAVARTQADGLAITFTEVLGLESYDHLRKVVRFNAGRALEHVEEELQTHAGIKQYPQTPQPEHSSDESGPRTS
jgi:hypothetical protein